MAAGVSFASRRLGRIGRIDLFGDTPEKMACSDRVGNFDCRYAVLGPSLDPSVFRSGFSGLYLTPDQIS